MDELTYCRTKSQVRMVDATLTLLRSEACVVLHGGSGTGKSTLTSGVAARWPARVLILSPICSRRTIWEWCVVADTQSRGNLTGSVFPHEVVWTELLLQLKDKKDQRPLLIINDGHEAKISLAKSVCRCRTIMPEARILITGNFSRRRRAALKALNPVWLILQRPELEECRVVMASHAGIEKDAVDVLSETFLRRVRRASGGDLHLIARVGWYLRHFSHIDPKQNESYTVRQQYALLQCLTARTSTPLVASALLAGAILCTWGGWQTSQQLSQWLPVPAWLQRTGDIAGSSTSLNLASQIMTTNESIRLLYNIWGYDVDKSESWCDQTYRAGITCASGVSSLETLKAQRLPWIALLKTPDNRVPVVVIGVGSDHITALTEGKTWLIKKAWFNQHWDGNYTLFWKPSPGGKPGITRKSSEDDIAWLDMMLSRVLNCEAEGTSAWTPLLDEKVRQFQTQNNLRVDGNMGKRTLTELWQALGESPVLMQEGARP
ncbi:peptidoglycan-binding domain-containing protein [Enterobacter chuandaensis]